MLQFTSTWGPLTVQVRGDESNLEVLVNDQWVPVVEVATREQDDEWSRQLDYLADLIRRDRHRFVDVWLQTPMPRLMEMRA